MRLIQFEHDSHSEPFPGGGANFVRATLAVLSHDAAAIAPVIAAVEPRTYPKIVRVRMPNAVNANTLHDTAIPTPVLWKRAHVVFRSLVNCAHRTLTVLFQVAIEALTALKNDCA